MTRFGISRLVWLAPLALAASVPATAATASAAAATTTYTITDLGSLGYGVTDAVAVNANGQVTGHSYTGKTITLSRCCSGCYTGGSHTPCVEHIYHAFVWGNGTMTDLGTLGGNFSAGNAINRSGEVAGSAQTKAGATDAFLWNGSKMIDLTTTALSGLSSATVAWINDSGQIAGTDAAGSTGLSQPFLDSNGKITQLPLPSFASASPATGCDAGMINNTGVVLGGCDDANSFSHGVVWQNGTVTDLGTLGGPQTGAAANNNLTPVVGWSQTSTDADHGFLWSNGKMTDLGLNFFPAAINDNGIIVGGDESYSGGTLQNLNNLIPPGSPYQIQNATGINNNGQIVASAYDTATYQTHALLLTPS
jgi:probable HAF family extracellular repeat protein